MDDLAINGGPKTINKDFNLGATYFQEEIDAVTDVISSNTISGFVANDGPKFYGGKKVKELESSFKKYFNINYAVASNSATSSLHSALVAIGIKKGDEVIVPAVSMSASAASILMSGGTPVFVDINNGKCSNCNCQLNNRKDAGCFNINSEQLENKITKNTKAIMVVHLFGKSADMNTILKISKKYNLKIIEDCAQAPGTRFYDKFVGTFGDIGIFSFNQSKTISAGEGGVAITNNEKYAARMQLIRNHAEAMIDSFPNAETKDLIGFNYRMTDLEAAVAVEQFKRLDNFNNKKIELANKLSELLSGINGIRCIEKIHNCNNAVFIYPLIYDNNYFTKDRDWFVKACNAEGVPMVSGYTTPLVDLSLFKQFSSGFDYPNARELHNNKLISIKICHHYNVNIDDITNCSKAIIKVINNISPN